MSQTITAAPTVTVTPLTERVVAASQTAQDLVDAAEKSPVVKADLQSLFASYSHNPLVMGLVPIVGGLLTQEHITVDSTLLTVVIGLAVTIVGYFYQWIAMKLNQPLPSPGTPK